MNHHKQLKDFHYKNDNLIKTLLLYIMIQVVQLFLVKHQDVFHDHYQNIELMINEIRRYLIFDLDIYL